jgi:hypothetical protein
MITRDVRLLSAGEEPETLHPAVVPVASSIASPKRLAPEPEGSSRLDRDRAASFADEGGASAARYEARDVASAEPVAEDDRMRVLAALVVLSALVIWILYLTD